MLFVTLDESREIAIAHGLRDGLLPSEVVANPPFQEIVSFEFANQRGRSFALASLVAKWIEPFQRCTVIITEYGIWPSSENMHLYHAVRSSYGNKSSLADAPGHVFFESELSEFITILDIVLQFGWGCVILKDPNDSCIVVSHDEWLSLISAKDLTLATAEASQFGLRALG